MKISNLTKMFYDNSILSVKYGKYILTQLKTILLKKIGKFKSIVIFQT